MLKETVFAKGKPIGVLIVDTFNGQMTFTPAEEPSLLSNRRWKSLDEMRQAVIKAYTVK